MNKLFTKVATLCVGLAMAAGVGVAVGASSVSEAKATSYSATIAKGENAYDDCTINGKFSIKAGASSKQGSMTITIPSASAKTLSFYAAAWNGDSKVVELSATGVTLGVSSITLTNDSALTGTGKTFTLAQDEETYYFEIDLTNCSDNAVVTLTAKVANKNRFFVWDAQYDDGESGETVDVTGVSLDKDSIELTVPNSDTLTPTVAPENATNKKVTWESSNPLVATVANGIVKAVDKGTATITVTTQDGSFTDQCSVEVSLPTITDVTVAQAIEAGTALADGATSTEYYRVTGYVVAVTYPYSNGTMTFTLADEKNGTSTVTCYKFACTEDEAAKIVVDKKVTLAGNVQNYVKSSEHTYEIVNNLRSQTKFPEDAPTVETIAVTTQPSKVEYEIGDELDTTGLVVTATYSDSSSKDVTSQCTFNGFESETAGEKTVNVFFENHSTSFSVTVNPAAPTDWDSELRAKFEAELDGFVPPYVASFDVENAITVYEGQGHVEAKVASNVVSEITTAFVGAGYGEPQIDDGAYLYLIETTNGSIEIHYGYDESYTNWSFVYSGSASEGWGQDLLDAFGTSLHGVVPYYEESVKELEYVEDYDDFELGFADLETAGAQLATLCQDWNFEGEGAEVEYWTYSTDETGYAVGYLYTEDNETYSPTIQFQQVAYTKAMQEAFEAKLNNNVPPFLNKVFATFTYVDAAGMFCSDNAMKSQYLSNMQSVLANANFALMQAASTGTRYVVLAGSALEGTVYQYGADCEDGGIMVVELFVIPLAGALTVNVYYQAMPVSIALSGECKTVFEYEEEFSHEGLVVTATMSDSSEMDVTEYAEFSGYNASVSGEQTITVTVVSVQTTYTVTVKEHVPVMTGIQVSKNPTKVEYEVGEEFDPSGIEVKAVYDVGDPVVVDLKDVSFSGFDSATAGEKTVTVSYGDFSTTIKVTVKKAAYTAEQFAEDFLAEIEKVCKGYDGKKNNKTALSNVWTKMSARYNELSSEEKTKIANATPKADGDAIQRMLTFYNYACKKYGLTKFISTQKSSLVINSTETTNNNLPIIVIVASAIAAVTAIGVVIGLKRRKNLLVK